MDVKYFVIEINETLIKERFLGFHNMTAPSLSPSLGCISCLLEHYLVAMQPDDKGPLIKRGSNCCFPGMSQCRINDLNVIRSGSNVFSFILAFGKTNMFISSPCCISFEISFVSLPLTVLTGAHCKPLTISQEAAAALNQWMHAHRRQT